MQNTSKEMLFEIKRKIFHLLAIFLIFINYKIDNIYFDYLLLIFTTFLIFIDFFKIYNIYINNGKFKYLNIILSLSREKEKNIYHLTGTSYFFLGFCISTFLFEREITTISSSIIIISDSIAAIIGKNFGKYKILKNKTIEGTVAFFFSTFLLLILLQNIISYNMSYFTIFTVSLISTLFEAFSEKIKMNDNFSVPIFAGFSLFLIKILS